MVMLDFNVPNFEGGTFIPPFDALSLGTEDRQCRVRALAMYELDGTTLVP